MALKRASHFERKKVEKWTKIWTKSNFWKNEKFREYQAARRSLVEELGAEKDRSLAQAQKMTVLVAENEDLKLQIKSLKDKFEILAEEIEAARVKNEIRALHAK